MPGRRDISLLHPRHRKVTRIPAGSSPLVSPRRIVALLARDEEKATRISVVFRGRALRLPRRLLWRLATRGRRAERFGARLDKAISRGNNCRTSEHYTIAVSPAANEPSARISVSRMAGPKYTYAC